MTPAPVTETGSVATETLPDPSRVDQGLRWFTSILLLIFPTATLFVNRGDSYVLGLLTLIGIWVWFRDGARRWLDRPAAVLWIAFALFFTVALLSYLLGTQTDAGFRFLGRYLRFLLIVPVYLALRRYAPTANTVFVGLALGALLAGIIGGLHVYHTGAAIRVEATTELSIIFGDLTTTMTLCTVGAYGVLAVGRRKWAVALLILCIAGGIVAALLSGVRGAWLALLLLVPALVIQTHKFLRCRYLLLVMLIIVSVPSFFYLNSRSNTRNRVDGIFNSTKSYFIAKGILTRHKTIPNKGSYCDDDKAFLSAWSRFYPTQDGLPKSRLNVVRDPLSEYTRLCRGQYVVRLHNSSQINWAEYYFPRMRTLGSVQSSAVFVRGEGWLVFGESKSENTHFKSSRYIQLEVANARWAGVELRISIPPDETAWLVPTDSYFGEYTATIADTSVGKRFEMWRGAWVMFLQHPLLGVGAGAYQDVLARLIGTRKILPFAGGFDHPHSDYFNALASAGIVGFLTLLAILVVPFVRFWRALRDKDAVSHAVGLAGALTVLGFAIYALTDTIFLHSMMITWYVVYMALFYALLDVQANKLAKPPLPTP